MNDLQLFHNKEFGEIRALLLQGEPWFVAVDVCRVLEISNPTDALKRLDGDERARFNLGRQGEANIVNEAGLYQLVLGSRKPEAKDFRRWITHEVLPTIRKTGGYVVDDDLFINTYLPYADEHTRLIFASTLRTIRKQNDQIAAAKPKVLFADAVAASDGSIPIGDLAKVLKQNGLNIGRNRLFADFRRDGYLIKFGEEYNMPTQRAMNLGLFEIKESTINTPDGKVILSKTPKITGKGQCYFVNRYLGGKQS